MIIHNQSGLGQLGDPKNRRNKMNKTDKVKNLFSAKNAKSILNALLREGTGWVLLFGAVSLLTADVWLGANVLQFKGMSAEMAWLLSASLSALQIALFVRGNKILKNSHTKWQLALGISALVFGWVVVLCDSLLDSFASFTELAHQLPTNWSDIGKLLNDPVVFICFITFFVLSFLGERLARLIIAGKQDYEDEDEDEEKWGQKSVKSFTEKKQMPLRPGSSTPDYGSLPTGMPVNIYLRNMADGEKALVVGADRSRYTIPRSDERLKGLSPING